MLFDEILQNKKAQIEELKNNYWRSKFLPIEFTPAFSEVFVNSDEFIILPELRRFSPLNPNSNPEYNPMYVAKWLDETNAEAMVIDIDKKAFGQTIEEFKTITNAIHTPVLYYDFVMDTVQIGLAKYAGASAIVLNYEIVNKGKFAELLAYAEELNLDVVVEIFSPDNLNDIYNFNPKAILLNTDDWKGNHIEKENILSAITRIPQNIIKLIRTEVKSAEEVKELASYGIDGLLVSELILRAFNPRAAYNSLRHIKKSNIITA